MGGASFPGGERIQQKTGIVGDARPVSGQKNTIIGAFFAGRCAIMTGEAF
jgi:hypothetical protein